MYPNGAYFITAMLVTKRTHQSGTGSTDIPREARATRASSPYLLEEYASKLPLYSLEACARKFAGSYRPIRGVFS